jgi:hypothetical protein
MEMVEKKPNTGSPASKKEVSKRSVNHKRKSLIPKSCVLSIPTIRIDRIYRELQRMDVDVYPNSCSVLLRVFIELSFDHYCKSAKILLKKTSIDKNGNKSSRDLNLREKIIEATQHMESNGIADKNELRGIRSLSGAKNSIVSLENLHAFVHNDLFNPVSSELMLIWDNIQSAIEKIWR